MAVSLTLDKLEKMKDACTRILTTDRISVPKLAELIGKDGLGSRLPPFSAYVSR